MNYILNIHTTQNKAIVNISNEGSLIGTLVNESQNQHARFLHSAIQELLQKNTISASDLKAIGVTGGAGLLYGHPDWTRFGERLVLCAWNSDDDVQRAGANGFFNYPAAPGQ